MTKKTKVEQNETVITELTIDRNEFKKVITERISIGEEILKRTIQTDGDFKKMSSDYSLWNDYNAEYLKQSFNNPMNEYRRVYENTGDTIIGSIITSNSDLLQTKRRKINSKIESLKKLLAKVDLLKTSYSEINNAISNSPIEMIEKNEVFIVHGHDEEAKVKTALFVERLGFKPVILHEQSSSGKTIIEKIEEYSNVGFGIVLYTPCDIGSKNSPTPELKFRARQNVVFEHGYLIGKIGRNNVCALVKGDIETPNDISGVVYIKMDDADAWHLKLAKELKSSGFDVDLNKIL